MYVCVCVRVCVYLLCVSMHALVNTWRSEDSSVELALSSHLYTGSQDCNVSPGLNIKHVYLLNRHVTSPESGVACWLAGIFYK